MDREEALRADSTTRIAEVGMRVYTLETMESLGMLWVIGDVTALEVARRS